MAWKELNKRRKINHVALAQTIKLLLQGPITAHELAEYTGIHPVTAAEWMRGLRREGVVHVCGWLPDSMGRDATAVFKMGAGRDKPRSKMTQAERQARYRQKQKQITLAHQFAGAIQ